MLSPCAMTHLSDNPINFQNSQSTNHDPLEKSTTGTWKFTSLKRIIIFQTLHFLGFHVHFLGCNPFVASLGAWIFFQLSIGFWWINCLTKQTDVFGPKTSRKKKRQKSTKKPPNKNASISPEWSTYPLLQPYIFLRNKWFIRPYQLTPTWWKLSYNSPKTNNWNLNKAPKRDKETTPSTSQQLLPKNGYESYTNPHLI